MIDFQDLQRHNSLYRAVIRQHIVDACKPRPSKIRDEGREWFGTEGFEEVCKFADVEAEKVLAYVARIADGGWKFPKELVVG